mmetsp:Transcript_11276/g.11320  ORF Transcript_11276/g.11320 Transcript_11276/m.11320 type:complete len:211 (-) Transcript_11276:468-1100(-)
MNFENLDSSFQIRHPEFNLSVQPPGPGEGGVEGVGSVGGHEDLHVASGLEAVQLVHNLQHGPLDLTVPIPKASSSHGIDLIKENDAGLLLPSHLEDFSHHPSPFSNVALDKFGAYDSDEAGVSPVGHCPGSQGLASPWRPKEQHPLGRIYPQLDKPLWVQQWHLHHFPYLFNLFLAPSQVVVCHIWLLFHSHHCDCRVYLGRKRQLDRNL